jgi:hypothetical protein
VQAWAASLGESDQQGTKPDGFDQRSHAWIKLRIFACKSIQRALYGIRVIGPLHKLAAHFGADANMG